MLALNNSNPLSKWFHCWYDFSPCNGWSILQL